MELPAWMTCSEPTKDGGMVAAWGGRGGVQRGNGIMQCCNGARGDEETVERTVREAYASPGAKPKYKGQSAGVGIVFEDFGTGAPGDPEGLVVEGVKPGGPAEGVKEIQRGLILIGVDQVDVRGFGSKDVGPIILGPPNSTVTLVFQDGQEVRRVTLTRAPLG
mmetsp:Transcript_25352/g.49459  ORF Transcript_25352/g.49459 Transcript_25352/m.49459 type:complete len:163 (+) Transcript_25352:122-610(+)